MFCLISFIFANFAKFLPWSIFLYSSSFFLYPNISSLSLLPATWWALFAPRYTSLSSQWWQMLVPGCGNTLCEGHERRRITFSIFESLIKEISLHFLLFSNNFETVLIVATWSPASPQVDQSGCLDTVSSPCLSTFGIAQFQSTGILYRNTVCASSTN